MEAYQKLNQGNNKLFYYLTKTPVKRDKQELKVNDDTNEYQWNNSLKIEYIETLNIVTEQSEQYIIYADHCLLDPDYMLENNIIFKKIPRDIKRF